VKKITIINIFFIYPPHCIVALSNFTIPNLLLDVKLWVSATLLDVSVSVVPLDELLDELFLQDEIVRLRNKISKMNKTLFIFSIHQK
jgi:hypothetical protein